MIKQKVKKKNEDPYQICQNIYFEILEESGRIFDPEEVNKKVITMGGELRLNINHPPKLLINNLYKKGYLTKIYGQYENGITKILYQVIKPWHD